MQLSQGLGVPKTVRRASSVESVLPGVVDGVSGAAGASVEAGVDSVVTVVASTGSELDTGT